MGSKWLALLSPLLLAGCSASANIDSAKAGVQQFHSMMNASQFQAVYDQSDAAMKQATPADRMFKFLSAVHRKLGAAGPSSLQNWYVNYTTSGQFVTLNYKTTFASGFGDENFIYRVDNGVAKLVGYHINSDALITN
jgi:outer membrane murein-binding lipoprotein Lpp